MQIEAAAGRPRLVDKVRPWLPRRNSLLGYLVAAVLVGLGALARLPLGALTPEALPPFVTLYPAIVIAAFAGGSRAGVLAVLLSGILAGTLWLAPSPDVSPLSRAVLGGIYLLAAFITVLVSGLARQLLDESASSEALQDRVARESVHRIKNLLAVVQSISRKISKSAESVEIYNARLAERLVALGATQDLLLKKDWGPVPLEDLVNATLRPFTPNPRLLLQIEPGILVPSRAVTQLNMALFELATNSMKYGGLTSIDGTVHLQVRKVDGHVRLRWRETGLTAQGDASGSGLGASVIRSALMAIRGAHVDYVITNDLVVCDFCWPLDVAGASAIRKM